MRGHRHGDSGPPVVVLHGGPGAPGSACGLARGLAASFRVVEPFQRGSAGPDGVDTGEPLTVARHVADLDQLVMEITVGEGAGGDPLDRALPALVGHSWGAMLALAYAAAHPGRVAAVALVGCGTYDLEARERLRAVCDERTDEMLRARLAVLTTECPDPDVRLRRREELFGPLYSYDAIDDGAGDASDDDRAGGGDRAVDLPPCDERAHRETWSDMLRLQAEGVYPPAFAAITAPVLMLHGAHDPHPGRMIQASLLPHLPQLEYVEWERCGHYPWRERGVRESFMAVLGAWLRRRCARPARPGSPAPPGAAAARSCGEQEGGGRRA